MTSLKKDFTSEAALQSFAASLGPQLQAGDVWVLVKLVSPRAWQKA